MSNDENKSKLSSYPNPVWASRLSALGILLPLVVQMIAQPFGSIDGVNLITIFICIIIFISFILGGLVYSIVCLTTLRYVPNACKHGYFGLAINIIFIAMVIFIYLSRLDVQIVSKG